MRRISLQFDFDGAQGHPLAGRLELPIGTPRAYALFAHCFTCSKDVFAAARIARALAEEGIAVLRFDFTGLGQSGGEFANTDFSSNVQDLIAASRALGARFAVPGLMIGHSLGGAAVLAAAGDCPDVRGVATIGAPADPGHVAHFFADKRAQIEAEGAAEVDIAGRRFTISADFLTDIDSAHLEPRLRAMRCPVMVMHAPQDAIVEVENAERIFTLLPHPKSYMALDGADHLLTRRRDAEAAASLIASWAQHALGLDAQRAEEAAERPQAVEGEVLVTETGEGRYANLIQAGRHIMLADEPEAVGGTDLGPSPYPYLLAALGACTSMTLRMYAERKGWALERVGVRLRHAKIHAQDGEAAGAGAGPRIDQIERRIALIGDLDIAQRARLLEIADRCPVHRTLEGAVQIVTGADEDA